MSDVATPRDRTVTIPTQQSQSDLTQKGSRRGGLLLVGLLLIVVSVFGFWFVLRSVDQRQQVVVAARTIQRWEVVSAVDFMTIEANVGQASSLGASQLDSLTGRWATGTIPVGTIVTEGLFQFPPLSGEDESGKVIIELSLPGQVPFGGMTTGDKLALFGLEEGGYGLIGVLNLDLVQNGRLVYIVTPEEALDLQEIVDRFSNAGAQRIWKVGFGLTLEDLQRAYDQYVAKLTGSSGPSLTDDAEG